MHIYTHTLFALFRRDHVPRLAVVVHPGRAPAVRRVGLAEVRRLPALGDRGHRL